MSIGLQYLYALCGTGDAGNLFHSQISNDLFYGDETEIFERVEKHLLDFGQLPKQETVEKWIGYPPETPEPPAYYLSLIEERYTHRTLNSGLKDCSELMKAKDYSQAVNRMQEIINNIRMLETRGKLVDFGNEALILFKQGIINALNPDFGIQFGWPTLDIQTNGVRGDDVVSTVGRPGQGKTYLLLKSTHHAWYAQQKKILFVSMEMPISALADRLTAIHTNVAINDIRSGFLPTHPINVEKKIGQSLLSLQDHPGKLWFLDGALTSTPEQIYSMASYLDPDMIMIDGAYLLRSENKRLDRYTRVAENAEAIKRYTKSIGKPVHCTYQFSREVNKKKTKGNAEIGLEDIAYSDVIGQVSSIVLGLLQEEEVSLANHREVQLLKGRNGETGKFRINWNFKNMDFEEAKETRLDDLLDVANQL